MKILVYGINFAPELTGTGKYTGEMAEYLAALGNDVRVVTAPPYYPQWQVQPGYSPWRYRNEWMRGCQVWRCPLWVPHRPRGFTRILHLLSFALSSFPAMLRQLTWQPRVVIVVAPTLLSAPVGWLVARSTGGLACLHIQDFELDVALGLGMVRGGFVKRIATFVERLWLRHFDRVSTISPKMMERLSVKGIPPEKTLLFPNWVDTELIYPLAEPSCFRGELGLDDDAFVALYAGNMGEKQGLDLLVEVARELNGNARIVFVLAGEGSAKIRLQREARGLSNVVWLPLQPSERLNDLLNVADVHLLPQRADAADLVMPSKLTGMLASGRPVIATAAPETQVANVVSGCGYVVPPGSISGIGDALEAACSDDARRKELGDRARGYACEHLSKEAVLGRFADLLEAAVAKKPM